MIEPTEQPVAPFIGRPPSPDPRSTRVVVRVTPQEAERIAAMARDAGVSVSTYIRRLLLG